MEIPKVKDNSQNGKSVHRIMEIKNKYDKFKENWQRIANKPTHKDHLKCRDIYVAEFKVFEGKEEFGKKLITVSSLMKGLNTYLPKTDYIGFTDLLNGTVKFVEFDKFIEFAKIPSINVKGDKDIIYYMCINLSDDISVFIDSNNVSIQNK